jgi:hypothetical protein
MSDPSDTKTNDKGQSTESRSQYYNKWDKLTKEQLQELEDETEQEKEKNDIALVSTQILTLNPTLTLPKP